MILKVQPTQLLKGRVQLPASKSYSIRAFIIAACGGESLIKGASDCDDAKVALSVARHLGAEIHHGPSGVVRIKRTTSKSKVSKIPVGESGTVLRFLLPLLTLYKQNVCVVGQGTLKGRPNYHLTQTLRAMGFHIRGKGCKESIPIYFKGGALKRTTIVIDGSLSSQFISALLIASPQFLENTKLVIKGKKIVSSDYIRMTEQVLEKSGVKLHKVNKRLYKIRGQQKFKGLKNFRIPSDYGLAAFLMAAGALVESRLDLQGCFDDNFIQADGRILEFLKRMGVSYKKTKHALKMAGPFDLKGGDFSLKACPDLVPIMAVVALFAKTRTRLYDIGHARVKESNRIGDLRKELLKIGANVKEQPDALVIYPRKAYTQNVILDPHQDHRLAMAFSILGLKSGVKIKDIDCVSKSYPRFVKDLKAIKARLKVS